MRNLEISTHQRSRLEALFAKHGHPTARAFASHLVQRALGFNSAPSQAVLRAALEARAEEEGCSGLDELVEQLIERELETYESPETNPRKRDERQRGLGYID